MSPFAIVALLLFACILLIEWVLLMRALSVLKKEKVHVLAEDARLPRLSILVAARNEEDSLTTLMQALDRQDYPRQLLEVIIADDQSEDGTWPLLQVARRRFSWLRTLQVPEGHRPQGKQGALDLLCREAKGHVWLFLDADTLPPPSWAREMASRMEESGADLLSGTTIARGKGLLASLQQLDWMQALCMLRVAASVDQPLTLLGNNFGFRRKAYHKTGSWASLPEGPAEDYAMCLQAKEKGLHLVQVLSQSPVMTQSMGLRALYHQRKRWLSASRSVPLRYQFIMLLRWFKLPLLVGIATGLAWQVAAGLAIIHWLSRRTLFGMLARHIHVRLPYFPLLFFGMYELLLNGAAWLGLLFSRSIVWKGRKYKP